MKQRRMDDDGGSVEAGGNVLAQQQLRVQVGQRKKKVTPSTLPITSFEAKNGSR